MLPISICSLRDSLVLKEICLPYFTIHLKVAGVWQAAGKSSSCLSLSHRSGSARRMPLASFEFTNVRYLVTYLPSGRGPAASTPGDTVVKTKTATVEMLITETAGPKEKIKDSSWETLTHKVSVIVSLLCWGKEQGGKAHRFNSILLFSPPCTMNTYVIGSQVLHNCLCNNNDNN